MEPWYSVPSEFPESNVVPDFSRELRRVVAIQIYRFADREYRCLA